MPIYMILYLSLALCIFVSQHHSNSNVPTQVVPELSPELAALNLNMEELTQSAFDLRFIPFFFTNIILYLWLCFAFHLFAFHSVDQTSELLNPQVRVTASNSTDKRPWWSWSQLTLKSLQCSKPFHRRVQPQVRVFLHISKQCSYLGLHSSGRGCKSFHQERGVN